MFRIRLIQLCLLLLVLSQVPLFLQLTLTPDTVLYDLQARLLLQGGILYRDIVEPNLPGIVWIHAGLRSLFGWSPLVLRIFDLGVVAGISLLLSQIIVPCTSSWIAELEKSSGRRLLRYSLVLLIGSFYLSTSEWCHCQRDTWMLLPCLAAVLIRLTRLEAKDMSGTSRALSAFAEGVLWATAFWLKPFIALPALLVIVSTAATTGNARQWSIETAMVLLGGATTGAAGIFWMIQNGCWSAFTTMMLEWNGDYYQSGRSRWTMDRLLAHTQRFSPWIILHLPAAWLATSTLISPIVRRIRSGMQAGLPRRVLEVSTATLVLRALYAGWIVQCLLFQQLFDYVYVPAMILAISVCLQALIPVAAGIRLPQGTVCTRPTCVVSGVVLLWLMLSVPGSALMQSHRLRAWSPCVAALVTGNLDSTHRDAIAQTPFPRWTELTSMMEHLETSGVKPQRLMAYSGNLIHVYPGLHQMPPTRFVYLDALARCFPAKRQEMLKAVELADVDYVLADLQEDGWEETPAEGCLLPAEISASSAALPFPWNQTPVFRSGSYVLLRCDQQTGELSSEYQPLSRLRATQLTHRGSEPPPQ
ncbi:MAG: hypothetical protein JNM43_18205 [Planctomycetaceae bacterium]|nr:hypothetical protein [Planctomycetaceae bacterium]